MHVRRFIALLFIAFVGRSAAPLYGQDAADILRGRVVGPDRKPLEGVTVTATSLVNQTSRTARTDKDGRFTIIFSGGGDDYLMAYALIGYQPMRREVKREVDEDILVADAALNKTAVLLDAVRVQAGRDRPDRNNTGPEIGGREQTLNTANVPIDKLGDLAAMAATLPGVTMIPSADGGVAGFSVLGLGIDQNNITLNGLDFGGTDLPRDATTQTRVATSTFDPSRGGFSGAQIALRTNSGTNYVVRSIRQTVDAPSLQYTDAVGRQLGQRFSNLQLSGGMSGPIVLDKAFYNFSYQLGRRSSDLQTLFNTDAVALQRVGVSADSVFALMRALNAAGIPVSTSGIPHSRLTENGSFLGNFDFSPTGTHSFNVTANGRWNGSDGSNLSTTAFPAHGGESRTFGGTLQARHSSYFGSGFLDETSVAFSRSETTSDPYLVLPDGRVRVTSTFDDGTAGVSSLSIGGNSALPRRQSSFGSQISNQISWISLNNKHRFKLTTDARYNRYEQDNTTNRLGTFTYNSLADFEAGIPASFTRRLQPRTRQGDDIGLSASLGDSYRRTPRLQLTYGLRADVAHFQGNPKFNPVVDSIFGVRNDQVPRGLYLSPRFGFSWTYGTAPQVAGFEGAARGSRGTLSGGIGQFQNIPSSNLIAAAVDNTGLPEAAQQLACVGSAVPVPLWAQYLQNPGLIPSTCADGSTTGAFSSSVPNVSLFDTGYIPQRSWRANLTWNAPVLNNRYRTTVGGTYSLNLEQQGAVDLNFSRVQRFALASEGGRPVFVNPTSIVPATGSIISRDARVTQLFSQVTDYRSDLRSHSTQVQLGLSPVRFNSSFQWNATYVWQRVVDMTRGFNGGSTAGDPYLTQWARSNSDARHQITLNANYTLKNAVTFSAFGRVQSGNPFTPMVSGDVNGDGYGNNDRAFVFNPAGADSAVAAGISNLLTSAPSSVRDCLSRQLGAVAGRNSCQGPWSTSMSARISIMPGAGRLPERATISLGIANPLTGIDALVHGPGNLHGWGQSQFVDPTLLYVRGFDAAKQQFRYEVNPRFGANRQANSVNRAPMQLTLDVRLDIGPERERQDLALQLRAGRRGQRLNENAIKQRYVRSYPNPFEQMLRQHDSLGLSDDVSDSIAILNKHYSATIDSIWTPVAKYLAALPEKFDLDEAYEKVRAAQNKSLDQMQVFGPAAKQLLNDEQIRKLPPFIALFLDAKAIRNVRPGMRGRGPGGFGGRPGGG